MMEKQHITANSQTKGAVHGSEPAMQWCLEDVRECKSVQINVYCIISKKYVIGHYISFRIVRVFNNSKNGLFCFLCVISLDMRLYVNIIIHIEF